MSVITSFSMFFLSFFPLWISILFIGGRSIYIGSPNIWTEIISISLILVVSIFSGVILFFKLNPKDKSGAQPYTILTVQEEKTITAEFLLSYMLPLFAFDFTIWHEVVLFLIFFLVFAFLCIRHNYFSVNILLELMKYRFYNCELQNEDGKVINKVIVTQETLSANISTEICIRSINNEYSVQVESCIGRNKKSESYRLATPVIDG